MDWSIGEKTGAALQRKDRKGMRMNSSASSVGWQRERAGYGAASLRILMR